MVLMGFGKLWWIRLAADHQTVTMTFHFQCKFGFGKGFGASSWITSELVIDGCCTKSTFATLHDLIENWFIVVV